MGKRRVFMDDCGRIWEEGEDLVRPKDRGEIPIELLAAAMEKGPEMVDNLIAAGTPGGIERQEAGAQRDLVRSQQVPIKLGSPKELFEKLGFKFGRTVDKLFQEAALPEGWTKVPSPSHSSYSYVLDAKGRARWMIYYKGAFYDRQADGYSLSRRFRLQAQKDYDYKGPGEKPVWGEVLDYGVPFDPKETYHGGVKPAVIYRSQEKKFVPKDVWDIDRVERMVRLEMELWLDAQYPNHEDPLAYWD